jgi:hypothetical protein
MLELGNQKMGDIRGIFRLTACLLLLVPLGTTIGYNAAYHYRWMGWGEDTFSYWRKYAIADTSFYALYLLIALDILLWPVIAYFRGSLPKRVRMTSFLVLLSVLTIETANDLPFSPHYPGTPC